MSSLLERILNIPAGWVYAVVGALVFAEDALFVGFVIPGETAAVLGGVVASRGRVPIALIISVVVFAAVAGDAVGYLVGRRWGAELLERPFWRRRGERLDRARSLLANRGGAAVLLGRFVAFFRATMPALAGTARMPYRRFTSWNVAGGLVWGTGFPLLGFLAGNSYAAVARTAGGFVAGAVGLVVVVALVAWRIRAARVERRAG